MKQLTTRLEESAAYIREALGEFKPEIGIVLGSGWGPVADIVEVVSAIYPRFDRYLLSKVEHGEEYGIRLRADAQHELLNHFKVAQDASKAKRKPNRSKPRRISCRLTDKAYGLLQRELDRTGVTKQSWLEALIAKALIGGEAHE